MSMITAGNTAHFSVDYDSTLGAAGQAMAQAVLAACEGDFATLSYLFAISLPAANMPLQINIVSGSGGGNNDLVKVITCTVPSTFIPANLPALVVAEEAEIFMAAQQKGWIPNWSNGEALSRVCAQTLYPQLRFLWSTGRSWLNGNPTSTTPARSNCVDQSKPTDQDIVATGCGSLFLNYLAYQLGLPWTHIIRAGGLPTDSLKDTATSLGLSPTTAFSDFLTLLDTYFPPAQPANIADDDPFPLGRPSLYLRHNLADDGTYEVGPLANSPDIIMRNSVVASPQATFSTAASIASDIESDANVLEAQDNYLYLRVWNRGTDATDVIATVYWSPPATLVTPSMWNIIGSAPIADVPPGNVVEVTAPGITWSQADIPTPGHYCFIATAGSASEPAPNPGSFGSFQEFVDYIYSHNNITWRNFNVVSISGQIRHPVPHPSPGHIPLPFLLTGASDEVHNFTFETGALLPKGSQLALEVAENIGRHLRPAGTDQQEHEDTATDAREPRRLRITLRPGGRQHLGEIRLAAGTAAPSHLLVQIPEGHRQGTYDIFMRQLYAGREVGRISWHLVP